MIPVERVMKRVALVFASASLLALVAPSHAQTYLNGVPPGGTSTYVPSPTGTYSGPSGNMDDSRTRSNNWRDGSQDNWRDNNWREDQSGWRRNNWRDERAADDWRPRSYREDDAKKDAKDKYKDVEQDNYKDKDDDCGMTRNRTNTYSSVPCRR